MTNVVSVLGVNKKYVVIPSQYSSILLISLIPISGLTIRTIRILRFVIYDHVPET